MTSFEHLTAQECGVTAWYQKPKTVDIFFDALAGPRIMCTFISYSDSLTEIQDLVRNAFIEAFRPKQNECNSFDIAVTTRIYGDRYQCFFDRNIPVDETEYIKCRILESDNWNQLSTFEKTIKWADDLETHIMNIIVKNKVQLSSDN